jgi:cytidyltransferase-like protein
MPLIKYNPSLFPGAEVLVTGTFNVMHAGHVELFEFASQYGKVTVGINGDDYMKVKYGDKAIPLMNRAYVLRSCRYVEDVVFFNEQDPSQLILKLRPKYFVRGPDYSGVELAEKDALKAVGTTLVIHQAKKIHNSSQISPSLEKDAFELVVP